MENEKIDKNKLINSLSIVAAALVVSGAIVYSARGDAGVSRVNNNIEVVKDDLVQPGILEEDVLPSSGVLLPVSWKDLGAKLVEEGVIDAAKLEAIYSSRGGLSAEDKKMLVDNNSGRIKITKENAGYILNLLWALGLANKNPVLDFGEMSDASNGGAGNFASTGGWTISRGDSMDHYSRHMFIKLSSEQQALVDKVSRNIYRPCCGNSTHFPDCNHGMAMLGLLELMASQGVGEEEMYRVALAVNSYWFPDTYLTIATFMKSRGIDWKDISPKEILGANYSSGSGFANIKAQVAGPAGNRSGGGCGV